MNADPAILLDVSRLLSRLGKGPPTGIDRVEAEWLAHLGRRAGPHLLLARVRRGQLVLPPEAGPRILRWLAGQGDDLPRAAAIDRLRGREGAVPRAEAALRRMALARLGPDGRGLADEVAARLGRGAVYLNVGHSNLGPGLWRRMGPLARVVMIHDTIPLDHPEWTRSGQSPRFRERFAAAVGGAGLVLAVSQAAAADVRAWRARLGLPETAPVIAAPIGTRLAAPDPSGLPRDLDTDHPFLVALGTIEPRKNHALLLDAWEELARRLPAGRIPRLLIVGRRGWENREVFARLDRLPPGGPVRELAGLDDGAVAALLDRACALVMPSRAEGFGLPYAEAAGRGLAVLCAPLPAARELLGSRACYLPPDAPQLWAREIARLAAARPLRIPPPPLPRWQDHFRIVRRALRELAQTQEGFARPGCTVHHAPTVVKQGP